MYQGKNLTLIEPENYKSINAAAMRTTDIFPFNHKSINERWLRDRLPRRVQQNG
jgi:hypothetical protein